MKNNFKRTLVLLFCFFLLSAVSHAGEHHVPADKSSLELEKIKSLAGRWTSTTSMFGKKNERVYTEYKVTAGGSAVMETIFPGTPNEMVSMYYDNEDGKLTMTHYCIMRNRPTLTLVKSTDDTLSLSSAKKSRSKAKNEPSMSEVAITFKDKNHMSQTCGDSSKKDAEEMTMEYRRIK